jgi:hypothetical protein
MELTTVSDASTSDNARTCANTPALATDAGPSGSPLPGGGGTTLPPTDPRPPPNVGPGPALAGLAGGGGGRARPGGDVGGGGGFLEIQFELGM